MGLSQSYRSYFPQIAIKLTIVLFCCISKSQSQTVIYSSDNSFQVDRHQIINPLSYQLSNFNQRFTSTYSGGGGGGGGGNQQRLIFGITALDFKQSAASLSFSISNISINNANYDFDVSILNETVIYRLRIDSVVIFTNQLDEVYYLKDTLNCKVLNSGQGYRSQNYTFSVNVKPEFKTEVGQIYSALYYRGFNLFNPNGSYFHLNWQFHYNFTHYTIVFHTQDLNIISFIQFGLLLVDINYAQTQAGYQRTFAISPLNCSNSLTQSCPGKSQWSITPMYNQTTSYLFGLSKLNFTKHTTTNWFFDTSNINVLNTNYIQTNSLRWANVSFFIVAEVSCSPNSKYFDPSTFTCVNSCTGLYNVTKGGGGGTKICRKCHYSCQPTFCTDENSNKCKQCDPLKFRQKDTNSASSTFGCQCMKGYVDMGMEMCQPCLKYIPGCLQCSSATVCTTCDNLLQVNTNNQCSCQFFPTTTRSGQCRSLWGCLVYFTDPNKGLVCVECNITLNFVLSNYTCVCVAGYQQQSISGVRTCFALNEVCGDGIRTVSQPCDDFNVEDDDGCDSSCKVEPGFDCFANLRETSFCIELSTTLNYVGAMKILGERTADLYFSLRPFNKLLVDVGFLSKFVFSSVRNMSSMVNPFLYTEANEDENELRFRLRFDYTQDINQTILHNTTLLVLDRQHNFTIQTKFTISGANMQLSMQQGYPQLNFLNYLILILIILAFIALFISLFKENWVGIQLLHTYQFCYFYFLLLQDMEQKQAKFLSFLELSNGYSQPADFISYYEYMEFNRKIYIMDMRQEIMINLNYSCLLFAIPIILLIIRLLRPIFQKCSQSKITKHSSKQTIPRQTTTSPRLDYILSSEFIVGKVFVTFTLVFMNQILFSFFIQQAQYLQENQAYHSTLQQAYLLLLTSSVFITVGLLIVAALRPYNYSLTTEDQKMEEVVEFIKFKRFSATYPLIYSVIILTKIIFLTLFFTSKFSPYFMWVVEISYLIGFLIVKPYRQMRERQEGYSYLLHNVHNVWNSVGLILLIGVILMENFDVHSYAVNVLIEVLILVVMLVSLILAYLRLFASKRLANFRQSQNTKRLKDIKDMVEKNQLEDTGRTLKFEGRRNTITNKKDQVQKDNSNQKAYKVKQPSTDRQKSSSRRETKQRNIIQYH